MISEMPKTRGDVANLRNFDKIFQVLWISFAVRKLFIDFYIKTDFSKTDAVC